MATLKILSTEVLFADSYVYRDKPQLAFTYEVTNNSNDLIQASLVKKNNVEINSKKFVKRTYKTKKNNPPLVLT